MTDTAYDPIGHRPPRPRIETAPQYTPAPDDGVPDHLRIQLEHCEKMARQLKAERVWACVVQSAGGTEP